MLENDSSLTGSSGDIKNPTLNAMHSHTLVTPELGW